MKVKENKGIKSLVAFFAKIYPYQVHAKIKKAMDYSYTYWISNNFKSFGAQNLIYRGLSLYGSPRKCITIGSKCTIGPRCVFECYTRYQDQVFTPRIILGDSCKIGGDSHITCINEITFGTAVRCGRKIFITDNAHGMSERDLLDLPPHSRPLYSKGPVKIEDNVWIGEYATILPNVTIGRGSIIAAHAVVTKDIPPYSVAAGNPARIVKQLNNPLS